MAGCRNSNGRQGRLLSGHCVLQLDLCWASCIVFFFFLWAFSSWLPADRLEPMACGQTGAIRLHLSSLQWRDSLGFPCCSPCLLKDSNGCHANDLRFRVWDTVWRVKRNILKETFEDDLVLFLLSWWTPWQKIKIRKKGIIWLMIPVHHWRDFGQEFKQELEGR